MKTAMAVKKEMERRGMKANAHTYNSLIQVCRKCRPVEIGMAEGLFGEMKRNGIVADSFMYSTLLMCYVYSGDKRAMERGLDVFYQMDKRLRTGPVHAAGMKLLRNLWRRDAET